MKKADNLYIFIPILIILCLIALVLKKLAVPFASIFTIVIFDGMAVFFFLKAFAFNLHENTPNAYGIGFNLNNFVYSVCTIAILYRLQNWNCWQTWTKAAFFLLVLFTLLMTRTLKIYFKKLTKEEKKKTFLSSYFPWLFFIVMVPLSSFTNPRQFHNLFFPDTYEQYVRQNYSAEEGTWQLDLYKTTDASSVQKAISYFDKATEAESKEEYDDALEYYNKSIDLNPDDAEAIERRGFFKLTHLELSREMAQDAINDFNRAIELKPELAAAYLHKAMAYDFLLPYQQSEIKKFLLKAISLDAALKTNKFVKGYINREIK